MFDEVAPEIIKSIHVIHICDVGHNDDSICKNIAPIFCLVDRRASGNNILYQITSEWQRCPDVALITEVKSTTQLQAKDCFTLILGHELFSLLKVLLWLWNVEQQ